MITVRILIVYFTSFYNLPLFSLSSLSLKIAPHFTLASSPSSYLLPSFLAVNHLIFPDFLLYFSPPPLVLIILILSYPLHPPLLPLMMFLIRRTSSILMNEFQEI